MIKFKPAVFPKRLLYSIKEFHEADMIPLRACRSIYNMNKLKLLPHIQGAVFCHTDMTESSQHKTPTESIKEFNAEDQKKLLALQLEYDYLKYHWFLVPKDMTDEMWLQIFQSESEKDRLKLYSHFRAKEYRLERIAIRKKKKKQPNSDQEVPVESEKSNLAETTEDEIVQLRKTEGHEAIEDEGDIGSFISKTNPFLGYRRDLYTKNNAMHSFLHGQPLVLDMSSEFSRHTARKFFKTINNLPTYCVSPFRRVLCGVKQGSVVQEVIQTMGLDKKLFEITDKSYEELYDTSDLVYISEYATNKLEYVDRNKIYVLESGSMAPDYSNTRVAWEKSCSLKIPSYKLPIDDYLRWKRNSKRLDLFVIQRILEDLYEGHDIKHAFRWIPKGRGVFYDTPVTQSMTTLLKAIEAKIK